MFLRDFRDSAGAMAALLHSNKKWPEEPAGCATLPSHLVTLSTAGSGQAHNSCDAQGTKAITSRPAKDQQESDAKQRQMADQLHRPKRHPGGEEKDAQHGGNKSGRKTGN